MTAISHVTYHTESLPPLYSVRTPDGMYIAGFLTEENRAQYVERHGWEVVQPRPLPPADDGAAA